MEHISGPISRLAKRKFKLAAWLPKEEAEQAQVMEWAAMMEGRHPALKLLHASMNGILTDAKFGAKLKRLGRKAGVPDLFLPIIGADVLPVGSGFISHHGLWIELKRRTGGKVSDEQSWWHNALRQQGYRVEVCHGSKEAIAVIKGYLGMGDV